MYTLPSGLKDLFAKKPPLNDYPLRLVVKEVLKPRSELEDDDISGYKFVNHRFGENAAKYIIDPMFRGIFAGDARKLSMRSCFPAVFDAERRGGSIFAGAFSHKSDLELNLRSSPLVMKALREKWSSWSTKDGLQGVVDKLKNDLFLYDKFEMYDGYTVKHIAFQDDGTSILHLKNSQDLKTLQADTIFSTIAPPCLADLLPSKYPVLKDTLQSICSASVAVINLEYTDGCMPRDVGFGVLIPSFVNPTVLGITFDSCVFKQHDGNRNSVRITVMLGGEWFDQIPSVSESDLLSQAKAAAEQYLKLKDPINSTVTVNKVSIDPLLAILQLFRCLIVSSL